MQPKLNLSSRFSVHLLTSSELTDEEQDAMWKIIDCNMSAM